MQLLGRANTLAELCGVNLLTVQGHEACTAHYALQMSPPGAGLHRRTMDVQPAANAWPGMTTSVCQTLG